MLSKPESHSAKISHVSAISLLQQSVLLDALLLHLICVLVYNKLTLQSRKQVDCVHTYVGYHSKSINAIVLSLSLGPYQIKKPVFQLNRLTPPPTASLYALLYPPTALLIASLAAQTIAIGTPIVILVNLIFVFVLYLYLISI